MTSSLAGRRIVFTTDAVGGIWRYAVDAATELTKRGARVTLLGLGPEPSAMQSREAEGAGADLAWAGPKLEWTVSGTREAAALGCDLATRVAGMNADLLHLNAPALAGTAAFSLPTVVAAHSCLATWWRALRGTALPEGWRWHHELTGRGLRGASVAIAPSAAFAEDLMAVYGPLPALQIVPNGARPVMSLEPKQKAILAAGRWWDEGKNLAVLDAAAAAIDWPVLLAGPTQGPAGQRGESRNACLLGSLGAKAMAERTGRASIFVSLSLYEPFGLAVLEAASAGAALILSDIPTFRELWEGAARFVDPRDPQETARIVNELIAAPGLRTQLGQAAAHRVKRYSLAVQADGFEAAYGAALAGSFVSA